MTDTLKELVRENLDAAKANGYFDPGETLHSATAEEIMLDMITYSSDFDEEQYTPEELLPHVREWLEAKP